MPKYDEENETADLKIGRFLVYKPTPDSYNTRIERLRNKFGSLGRFSGSNPRNSVGYVETIGQHSRKEGELLIGDGEKMKICELEVSSQGSQPSRSATNFHDTLCPRLMQARGGGHESLRTRACTAGPRRRIGPG